MKRGQEYERAAPESVADGGGIERGVIEGKLPGIPPGPRDGRPVPVRRQLPVPRRRVVQHLLGKVQPRHLQRGRKGQSSSPHPGHSNKPVTVRSIGSGIWHMEPHMCERCLYLNLAKDKPV